MGTTEEVWKRLLEAVEELGVIKARVKKLEKENTELEARWTNLNEDVRKMAKVRAEKQFQLPRLSEQFYLTFEYDSYMYRATGEHDFAAEMARQVYRQILEEIQRRNREKKPT